ncbi:hypothetical protein BYT27DRAFT_7113719 [Phlegmacium glaucopus]|nr:hypothetical protein BYT27DRAFT_7113719 [Phlegmacium glaucopus]
MPLQPHINGHSRTRSISTPFSPSLPSPLSASFPASSLSPTTSSIPPNVSISHSAFDASQPGNGMPKGGRRHARLHSRNLSVFFPRPGSVPQGTIDEDGAQELEIPVDVEAPLIPSAGLNISLPGSRSAHQPLTPLGQGFTFGARPPSSQGPTPELMTAPHSANSSSSSSSRRGHHHKHSLSHNFFSFLEPGSGPPLNHEEELHRQPTPIPPSPWGPMSAFPASAAPSKSGFNVPIPNSGHANVEQHRDLEPGQISYGAAAVSSIQFVLGAWLWVSGQQVGSISCTGLGYWVVFDSFGVALTKVIPGWLASRSSSVSFTEKEKESIRRPYGNGRVETVLMFAQAVYLMFSSVYVCKETVEHLLLSSGEGHHHHHGDEIEGLGIDFPIFMILVTFISLLGTAIFYQNNTTIVNVTGNRIPSLGSIIRSLWSTSRHTHELPPTTTLTLILSNPFIACPLFFCVSILSVALTLSSAQHRVADLMLASLIAAVTFKVAYRASLVLGTVLLQTSPRRGLSNGKMEAFLRAMREVERHPQVVHLPAPHIWQLTPSPASQTSSTTTTPSSPTSNAISDSLVVTLELHVKEDLCDDDVLILTKWAWERCVSALGSLKDLKGDVGGGPEVTVGIVRG